MVESKTETAIMGFMSYIMENQMEKNMENDI